MNKINLVVPIAGLGKRFKDEGYAIPKPLIHIKDKTIIEHSMESIRWKDCNLIFIVRSEDVANFNIDQYLKQKFGPDTKVIQVSYQTQGSVCSVLLAAEYINNDSPLCVWCSDVYFEMKISSILSSAGPIRFDPYKDVPEHLDGFLLTFKSNSSNYSYVKLNEAGFVEKVAEKMVISEWANAGLYFFRRGSQFVKYAIQMIEKNDKTNSEFYLAPMYNYLISDGLKVGTKEVEKIHIFGTPSEYRFYKDCVLNHFGCGVIGIACDHSAYELKERLKEILDGMKLHYIDYGTYSERAADYVDYSSLLIKGMKEGDCTHGFLLCRTGAGQNMFANRFKHIRSVLINDNFTAEMAISHNCANVFCIPSKYVTKEQLWEMIGVLSVTSFSGGRHEVRVRKIMETET